MSEYHKTLGVPTNASKEEIKRAYKKLALLHHPDKGGNQELFIKIKDAYEHLYNNNTYSRSTRQDHENKKPESKGLHIQVIFGDIVKNSQNKTVDIYILQTKNIISVELIDMHTNKVLASTYDLYLNHDQAPIILKVDAYKLSGASRLSYRVLDTHFDYSYHSVHHLIDIVHAANTIKSEDKHIDNVRSIAIFLTIMFIIVVSLFFNQCKH